MKAGAIEFLTKPFREQDLLDAIEQGLALDRAELPNFTTLNVTRAQYLPECRL